MKKMKKQTNDYADYGKRYNENGFWATLGKAANTMGRTLVYPALLLYYELGSPDTPFVVKVQIVGALGYFVFPLDLIPDAIPVVGWGDDLEAIKIMVKLTSAYITPDVKAKAKKQLEEWFGKE